LQADPVVRIWASLSPKPLDFHLVNLERCLLKQVVTVLFLFFSLFTVSIRREGTARFMEVENGQVLDYVVCLFNDVLLICDPSKEKGKMRLKYLIEFAGRTGIRIEDDQSGFSSMRPGIYTTEGY